MKNLSKLLIAVVAITLLTIPGAVIASEIGSPDPFQTENSLLLINHYNISYY